MRRTDLALLFGAVALIAAGCGSESTRARATATAAPQSTTTRARGVTTTVGCASSDHGGEDSRVKFDHLATTTKTQVDKVRAVWAHKYPTAADAQRAGWFKATPNLFGIGAHYVKDVRGFSVAAPFDLLHPPILLYAGEGPDAKFAGVSYVVKGNVQGFNGCYDVWHTHKSVCIDREQRVTLTEPHSFRWYSESECLTAGGRVMPLAADKMIHLWIGPGYTGAPTFAHDNPKLFHGYYPKHRA